MRLACKVLSLSLKIVYDNYKFDGFKEKSPIISENINNGGKDLYVLYICSSNAHKVHTSLSFMNRMRIFLLSLMLLK